MTKVDQFESIFRSATRDGFVVAPPKVERVLLVTDLDDYETDLLHGRTRTFLAALGDSVDWRIAAGAAFRTVQDLLDLVEEHRPDLICTYRHLHTNGWQHGITLGDHVEVLTQATDTPVLLLPHPQRTAELPAGVMDNTSDVMAITDHLSGAHLLVNWAARFTQSGGRLFLSHVEDDRVFERYLDTIGRIPEIDTDLARVAIHDKLLSMPRDYIGSCRDVLRQAGSNVEVDGIVRLGHRLRDYVDLVNEHTIDLLVLNTKDQDQTAMHGLAYPLAVELTTTPMLML